MGAAPPLCEDKQPGIQKYNAHYLRAVLFLFVKVNIQEYIITLGAAPLLCEGKQPIIHYYNVYCLGAAPPPCEGEQLRIHWTAVIGDKVVRGNMLRRASRQAQMHHGTWNHQEYTDLNENSRYFPM